MADEFEFFTEAEKKDMSYKMCVGGMALTGVALGSMAGGQAILGGAGGLIWGLLTCPKLSIPIKKKLFSQTQTLNDGELAKLVSEVRRQRNYIGKGTAMKVLAHVRQEVSRNPGKYKKLLA